MTIRNSLPLGLFLSGAICSSVSFAQAPQSGPALPAPTTPAPTTPVPVTPAPPPAPTPADGKPSSGATDVPAALPSAARKAVGPGTPATVLDTSAIQGLIGRSVRSYAGDDMGQIVDCLVTPAGQARAVVIDFGGVLGVGSRKVAVDWSTLDFSGATKGGPIILALTRNEVRVSPEYKVGDPVVVLESAKPNGPKSAASVPGPPQPDPAAPVAPAGPQKN